MNEINDRPRHEIAEIIANMRDGSCKQNTMTSQKRRELADRRRKIEEEMELSGDVDLKGLNLAGNPSTSITEKQRKSRADNRDYFNKIHL